MKKPFKDTRFWKFVKGLAKNTIQTTPVIGTIVTAADESRPTSAPGKINLNKWHYFRIGLGVVVAYAMYKGVVDTNFVDTIKEVFSMLGM